MPFSERGSYGHRTMSTVKWLLLYGVMCCSGLCIYTCPRAVCCPPTCSQQGTATHVPAGHPHTVQDVYECGRLLVLNSVHTYTVPLMPHLLRTAQSEAVCLLCCLVSGRGRGRGGWSDGRTDRVMDGGIECRCVCTGQMGGGLSERLTEEQIV